MNIDYHTLIYNVAVHLAFQRQGIGNELVRSLLAQCPVWRAMLVAASDVQPFYQRLGFVAYPDVMARLDWNRLHDASSTVLPEEQENP